MGVLIVIAMAFALGWSTGYARRERHNQAEWKDYQEFLRQQRPKPRFAADRWGVSTKPSVLAPE